MNNTGQYEPVMQGLEAYLAAGVREFKPLTKNLRSFIARPMNQKFMRCPSRMIDEVQKMVNSYRESSDDNGKAIHAPLPQMFLAYAKDANPIPTDRGRSVSDVQKLALTPNSPYYAVRMQHKSWRTQLVFMAHDTITVKSMADQMRLYMQRFENHRWAINWHHDSYDFVTMGTFEEGFEPFDTDIEIDGGRNSLYIIAWDLTINFPLMFVDGSESEGTTFKAFNRLKTAVNLFSKGNP